ncbi:MAG: sel1 repeat family protein [Candidatus Riflebacteria bacterium]|nr:sel1 repeat family protein [Candidatus Riflebacteria bacterium]
MWHLSQCYSSGNGVPKDFKEALKWCQKAAEYGYIYAQGHLVMLYAYGRKAVQYPGGRKDEGVPKDYVLSYMWDLIWCENTRDKLGYIGSDAAFIGRLSEKMSPDQIERAKELARNWKPKIQKRPEPLKMKIPTPPTVIQGQPGIIEDIPHPPGIHNSFLMTLPAINDCRQVFFPDTFVRLGDGVAMEKSPLKNAWRWSSIGN